MLHTYLKHSFVDEIPEQLEEGVLYISINYATAVHLCCCGCGEEVVTPFTPNDWKLTFDGETITLYPSIGNWSFPCRSHYFIQRGRIVKAANWTEQQIEANRKYKKIKEGNSFLNQTSIAKSNTDEIQPKTNNSIFSSFFKMLLNAVSVVKKRKSLSKKAKNKKT